MPHDARREVFGKDEDVIAEVQGSRPTLEFSARCYKNLKSMNYQIRKKKITTENISKVL